MTDVEWAKIIVLAGRLTKGRFVLTKEEALIWLDELQHLHAADVTDGLRSWCRASPHPPALSELLAAASVARARHEAMEREREMAGGAERISPALARAWGTIIDDILSRRYPKPDEDDPEWRERLWQEARRRAGRAA